mgnify:FL=1
MSVNLLAVYTTVGDVDDASLIANVAVERQLAACVQISAVESVYRWQGTVQQSSELRLLFKTTTAHYEALQSTILELHPYDLPAVYAMPVEQASDDYAAWVKANTR